LHCFVKEIQPLCLPRGLLFNVTITSDLAVVTYRVVPRNAAEVEDSIWLSSRVAARAVVARRRAAIVTLPLRNSAPSLYGRPS
jgi:hypothetical protein